MSKYFYGWRPDRPDHRDFIFSDIVGALAKLPESVDLRSQMPPIYDQSQLGSCTANAVAGHLDFNRKKQGEEFINPSRLFIYFNERFHDGTVAYDAGSTIRESIKAVAQFGAPPESEWPYDISKFTDKPSQQAYTDGLKDRAIKYLRIQQADYYMKSCLAQGYPFVGGITVYDSFHQGDSNGVIPMPSLSDSVEGGHALCFVGYTQNHWIFRNSWGPWGDSGYGYLPLEYLTNPNLASDFWTIRSVS